MENKEITVGELPMLVKDFERRTGKTFHLKANKGVVKFEEADGSPIILTKEEEGSWTRQKVNRNKSEIIIKGYLESLQ